MTEGRILVISVLELAPSASINMVASGVLVTDACVDAIRDMTATGETAAGKDMGSRLKAACARGAAAKKSGKIIPPGNLPAQARAMESNLALPTCAASHPVWNGMDGSTRATVVRAVDRPCLVAMNAVFWPSMAVWRLPSPQNIVCG